MKAVSQHFISQTLAPRKKIVTKAMVSWDKEFDPDRGFFILDASKLDSKAVLWNGNQDVAAFGDRYKYTDESENVTSYSVSQKASKHPWGVIQGTATLVLNNASGRYSPGKDSEIGIYVGLPNRPIKIQQEIDGESVNLFTGYAHRPSVTIQDSKLTIEARDAISFLAGVESNLPPIVDKRIDEIIAMLLLEQGFEPSQFVLEEGLQESIAFCAPNNEKILTTIQNLCESEQYLVFADGDGLIHGWNALHFTVESPPVREYDTNSATAMSWATTSILNDVKIQATPYKMATEPGTFYEMTDASDDTLIPAHGTLELFLSPEDENNEAIYGVEVEEPEYYGEKSRYLTNVEQDGGGDTNHDAITLDAFYNMNGKTMRLVFSNSSDTPTYITYLSFFGEYARKTYYTPTERTNSSSIRDYGVNPEESSTGDVYSIVSEYVQSREFASYMAEMLVKNYAQPYGEFTLDVFPTPYVEFGDIISADTTISPNISTANGRKRGIIFGIESSGNANGEYKQHLIIEQRQEVYSFVLDISKLDSGDYLGF